MRADATSNLDYYLIRNSWSSGWGEDGYIRLVRYGNSAKGEAVLHRARDGLAHVTSPTCAQASRASPTIPPVTAMDARVARHPSPCAAGAACCPTPPPCWAHTPC